MSKSDLHFIIALFLVFTGGVSFFVGIAKSADNALRYKLFVRLEIECKKLKDDAINNKLAYKCGDNIIVIEKPNGA
jgi:hypothetical protein